jgi:hypothetical protein
MTYAIATSAKFHQVFLIAAQFVDQRHTRVKIQLHQIRTYESLCQVNVSAIETDATHIHIEIQQNLANENRTQTIQFHLKSEKNKYKTTKTATIDPSEERKKEIHK